MTRFIADIVGSGLASLTPFDATSWPPGDAVNNTATRVDIALAPDGDTVTCTPKWVRADGTSPAPPVVETVSKYVFVGTGPMNYDDKRSSYPSNGTDLYSTAGPNTPPLTSLSLKETLPPSPAANISALPRTVDCTIRARDPGNNGLPIVVKGSVAIVDDGTGAPRVYPGWLFPLASCGSVYVANATDNANCGACGVVCPTGSTCSLGTCICSQVVTATATLTATAGRNVSVVLVGGGGGAAGLLSADDMAVGVNKSNAGYGGGGGSSAVVIGGSLALAAAGGAGGVGGYGPRYNASDAVGQPGQIVRALLPVPGGTTIRILVGGGGGGGGAGRYSGSLADAEVSVGGGGGAGWFGGGGGYAGNATMQASLPYFAGNRAGGGTGTAGGAGFSAGVQGAGGAGQAGSTSTGPSQQAAGGTLAAGGVGVSLESYGRRDINDVWTWWKRGGGGGGGAAGGGGGAGGGFSDDFRDILYGSVANGGGPGADGDQGSSGAATWAGGIKVGAGAGGTPQLSPDDQNIVITQGGAAGLAVLRWEAMGGVCAF